MTYMDIFVIQCSNFIWLVNYCSVSQEQGNAAILSINKCYKTGLNYLFLKFKLQKHLRLQQLYQVSSYFTTAKSAHSEIEMNTEEYYSNLHKVRHAQIRELRNQNIKQKLSETRTQIKAHSKQSQVIETLQHLRELDQQMINNITNTLVEYITYDSLQLPQELLSEAASFFVQSLDSQNVLRLVSTLIPKLNYHSYQELISKYGFLSAIGQALSNLLNQILQQQSTFWQDYNKTRGVCEFLLIAGQLTTFDVNYRRARENKNMANTAYEITKLYLNRPGPQQTTFPTADVYLYFALFASLFTKSGQDLDENLEEEIWRQYIPLIRLCIAGLHTSRASYLSVIMVIKNCNYLGIEELTQQLIKQDCFKTVLNLTQQGLVVRELEAAISIFTSVYAFEQSKTLREVADSLFSSVTDLILSILLREEPEIAELRNDIMFALNMMLNNEDRRTARVQHFLRINILKVLRVALVQCRSGSSTDRDFMQQIVGTINQIFQYIRIDNSTYPLIQDSEILGALMDVVSSRILYSEKTLELALEVILYLSEESRFSLVLSQQWMQVLDAAYGQEQSAAILRYLDTILNSINSHNS